MFNILKKKKNIFFPITVEDDEVVTLNDGKIIETKEIPDPIFSNEMLGKTIGFQFQGDSIVLCSPANGILTLLYPTGHAFGVTMKNGIELLVHIGINTCESKGDGFRLLSKQGKDICAGEPIVEVNLKKLGSKYNMSTMLIITDSKGKQIKFNQLTNVKRGEVLFKVL